MVVTSEAANICSHQDKGVHNKDEKLAVLTNQKCWNLSFNSTKQHNTKQNNINI